MKTIAAYKTSDGKVFENKEHAFGHQQDIIGKSLDDLVANDSAGNVTRYQRLSMLLNTMNDPEFKLKVITLYNALTYGDNSEDLEGSNDD